MYETNRHYWVVCLRCKQLTIDKQVLTRSRHPPNARQNTSGPARSVSCMIDASGCLSGWSTDSVLTTTQTTAVCQSPAKLPFMNRQILYRTDVNYIMLL